MRKIRGFNREIPIIVLTGYPSLDSAIETVKYQAVDYLRKPFDINELKSVLRKALDSSRLLPESKLIKLKGVGRKVREIRKKKRWSLDLLADKTGLSKSFLSEMERAKRFPRLNTLQKIAKVLEVNIQFFFNQKKFSP
jgi:DNA-binding NtrC family response regulator